MAKQKRLEIREELRHVYIDFDGRVVEDVIASLIDIKEEHKDQFYKLMFDTDYSYNEYENDKLILVGYRLENDKEYEDRMAKLRMIRENKKKAKANKEAEERALYEKLKAKYEGK